MSKDDGRQSTPGGQTSTLALADVQARLYDLITAPEGVERRLSELGHGRVDLEETVLESIVRSTTRLSAVERVDIYANMYFYRIRDVLRDEYAKLLSVLGDDAFHNLVTDYLLACRPAHPSLREVGARLPEYLARHPLSEGRSWVGELARLERTRLDLFDGPDCDVLTLDRIRALPTEALPRLMLRAIPCHAVLSNRFALSTVWTSLETGQSPEAHREAPPASPETLLVWRQGFTVYHRVVDDAEAPLLELLRAGPSFDVVCERVLDIVPAEQAVQRTFELLGRWVTDGLIAMPVDPVPQPCGTPV